jgi:hypothetical protein
MKRNSIRGRVCVLLVSLCIILVAASNAGVISIPPCAARPSDSTSTAAEWYSNISEFYFTADDTFADAMIPLHLPNGVSVKKLAAVLTDPAPGRFYNISVALVRVNLVTGNVETLGIVDTSDSSKTYDRTPVSTTLISHRTVNNEVYAYAIDVFVDSSMWVQKFHGAKIYY